MTTTNKKLNAIEGYLAKCLDDVTEVTGVKDWEIMSKSRGFEYVANARFLVYSCMRAHDLEPSYQQIGRLMNRHHGSVMNGIKAVNNLAGYDKKMKLKVKALRERGHRI